MIRRILEAIREKEFTPRHDVVEPEELGGDTFEDVRVALKQNGWEYSGWWEERGMGEVAAAPDLVTYQHEFVMGLEHANPLGDMTNMAVYSTEKEGGFVVQIDVTEPNEGNTNALDVMSTADGAGDTDDPFHYMVAPDVKAYAGWAGAQANRLNLKYVPPEGEAGVTLIGGSGGEDDDESGEGPYTVVIDSGNYTGELPGDKFDTVEDAVEAAKAWQEDMAATDPENADEYTWEVKDAAGNEVDVGGDDDGPYTVTYQGATHSTSEEFADLESAKQAGQDWMDEAHLNNQDMSDEDFNEHFGWTVYNKYDDEVASG